MTDVREIRPLYYTLAEELESLLDEEAQDAVYAYSEPGINELVNTRLRGLPVDDPELADSYVATLDQVLAEAPSLPAALTVYRGFAAGREFNAGETFSDPGFVSTTIDRAYAERFAERAEGDGIVVAEIAVPAGTRAAAIRELAEYPSEEELVLTRGSSFQVLATAPTLRLQLLR